MDNKKTYKKFINIVLVVLLSICSFPLRVKAETITVQNGNSHLVTGYATEIAEVYKVDIYWTDMTFVFDRGMYNSNDGSLRRASNIEGPEKNAQDGYINCWYGFDGIHNRVIILNRSNIDIYAKYSSLINGQHLTNVTSQLYDYSKDNVTNENYKVTISQDGENAGYPENFDDTYDKEHRFGNNQEISSDDERTLKAAPYDGTLYANKIFLNITGTPDDGFQEYELDSDDNIITADMGYITITLNKNESTN